MKIEDIKVGETYKLNKSTALVHFVGKEVVFGTVTSPLGGGYETTLLAQSLHPIVKRYVVEQRPPKVGERYFFLGQIFTTTKSDLESIKDPRPVIVEEL